MTGARLKLLVLALVGVLGAIVLLAWSQPWFTLTVTLEGGAAGALEVGGDIVAAALPPLALASFALVLALALAGPFFRVVLGILESLLGVCVALVAGVAIGDPVAASASAVTKVTGVDGADSIVALVHDVSSTGWPVVAVIAGIAMTLLGLAIVVTGGRWPRSGRKYSRSRFENADPSSPIDEWDALSEGDDPTGAPPAVR